MKVEPTLFFFSVRGVLKDLQKKSERKELERNLAEGNCTRVIIERYYALTTTKSPPISRGDLLNGTLLIYTSTY